MNKINTEQKMQIKGFKITITEPNDNTLGFILEPCVSSKKYDLKLLTDCDFNFIHTQIEQKINGQFEYQRTAMILLVEKLSNENNQEDVTDDMIRSGLKCYLNLLAIANIRTNLDVVYIQRQQNVSKEMVFQFALDLLKQKTTAVVHGAEFLFNSQNHEVNNQNHNNNKMENGTMFTLITGGSRGIGRATAQIMAKEGRNLVLTGRPGNKQLAQFGVYLQQKYNVKVLCNYLDIKDQLSCAELAYTLQEKNIQFQTVVFNAGVGSKTSLEQSSQNFSQSEALFSVNSLGPVKLLDFLYKSKLINQNTLLFVVSSVGSLRGFSQFLAADICSKYVLEAWTEKLIKKHKVMTIYPGATDTEMLQKSTLNPMKQMNKLEEFINQLPKRFVIPPQNIGYLITLFSNRKYKKYLNGSKIPACCGMHLDYRSLGKH